MKPCQNIIISNPLLAAENEWRAIQEETSTQKEKTQESNVKYIPPHLRIVHDNWDPRKEGSNPTVSLATMIKKLQPATLKLIWNGSNQANGCRTQYLSAIQQLMRLYMLDT